MSSPIELTSAITIATALVLGSFILPVKQPLQDIKPVIFEIDNQINQTKEINIKDIEKKLINIKKKVDNIEKKIAKRK